MANMKVFVSSTCYDLSEIRSQMRSLLVGLGFEPVMSEYSDVLFHPERHTHESCAKEVTNCDMVVLIIGGRFGGKVVPQALKTIDWEAIERRHLTNFDVKDRENLSVTQLEVISAIASEIPVFAFIEEDVWHDHNVYEQNKHKGIIKEIDFPSLEKSELAQYVFEFINLIRHRPMGNSIASFSKFEDISEHLKKQWSALFQRLLRDQKENDKDAKRAFQFSEQLQDIKTALITSIGNIDAKKAAKAAIAFRHLISFIKPFYPDESIGFLADQKLTLNDVFRRAGVQKIYEHKPDSERSIYRHTIYIVMNKGVLVARVPSFHLSRVSEDLNKFNSETGEVRRSVIDAVLESQGHIQFARIRFSSEEELLKEFPDKLIEVNLETLLKRAQEDADRGR